MAASPIVSAVFGATGLVGNHLLTALLQLDGYGTVHTITRRLPKQADATASTPVSPKLDAIVEKDNTQWPAALATLAKSDKAAPSVVFSSVGTTRRDAGGIANQWKIDHDLNVEIAKAAKAAGVSTFVFVSSTGIDSIVSRNAPYSKMKLGVEKTIRDLAFDQAIILRPGIIVGERENPHQGAWLVSTLSRGISLVSQGIYDTMAQDANVIARAAAHAALLASQGKAPSPYWVLGTADIVRLGRDEWKF